MKHMRMEDVSKVKLGLFYVSYRRNMEVRCQDFGFQITPKLLSLESRCSQYPSSHRGKDDDFFFFSLRVS